ncbi:hypothetical protein FNZ56_08290 [Pseudoluteimonas lycopersici]|uniref:Uncharacterized protein n=1 Tax=Pseudoluteimonas lycopersici TaxID=1324796 RepID=A0A516V5S7_9GAMM|nr:hypothetical protein [Lysobacter lycopersici]QDQ73876.1 hypothetical protein FNZ56_08290 [Lysobacter lycopersici]
MLIVFLAQPAVVAWYYQETLRRGWYEKDGDTIGIPIVGNLLVWAFVLPLVAWMLVWLWRRYEPAVSIFVTGSVSRLRSVGYTILAGIVVLSAALWVAEGVQEALWLTTIYALISMHAALVLRASGLGARVV